MAIVSMVMGNAGVTNLAMLEVGCGLCGVVDCLDDGGKVYILFLGRPTYCWDFQMRRENRLTHKAVNTG